MSNNPNKKKITPHNIKNYLIAQWRIYFMSDDQHTMEQTAWRYAQVATKSPQCIAKGECICECDIKEKINEPDACEEIFKCYPAWMNKEEWLIFKLENNIEC